jgi:hypothetical protein
VAFLPSRRPFRTPSGAARELLTLAATAGRHAASRLLQEVTRRGRHGAPITTGPDRTVLLFFEDVEEDRVVPNDRHLRRAARRVYHAVTEGRRVTGFEGAFRLLTRALERAGCRVVVNNARMARRYPHHPIGICGYPHALRRWTLPNPAVLGPGMFDHPAQAPDLMRDPRFRSYLVPCEWMRDLFAPTYANTEIWFGGIDVAELPDYRGAPKEVDFLVYRKILWNRDATDALLTEPLLAELRRRGLTYRVLPYGGYEASEYRRLLASSRGLLYLCEHETQGLAYQEAMACNVPVLAWDQGWWLDPIQRSFGGAPVPATSIPYFSDQCGERFADVDGFPAALDRFLLRRASYEPRQYVSRHLSMEESARRYLAIYTAAARSV